MRFQFGLALVFLIGGSLPALAQDNCRAPAVPVAPNGRAATQAQMMAAAGDARNFIAQSDVYQQCMLDYVKAQKDLAAKNKQPFDPSIEADAVKKITKTRRTRKK